MAKRSAAEATPDAQGRPRRTGRKTWQRRNKEFVVIGLGRFGTGVAEALTQYGHSVLAIDNSAERVQQLSVSLPNVVQLDATRERSLRELEVGAFDTGVVSIGTDFEANLLATVLLIRLGVRRVITKARTRTQKAILERIGAHQVILPEYEAGLRIARTLANAHIVDYLEVSPDVDVVECLTPRSAAGHTLRSLQLRQTHGLSVIAIRRDERTIVSPDPSEILRADDVLVVVGRIEDAERFTD